MKILILSLIFNIFVGCTSSDFRLTKSRVIGSYKVVSDKYFGIMTIKENGDFDQIIFDGPYGNPIQEIKVTWELTSSQIQNEYFNYKMGKINLKDAWSFQWGAVVSSGTTMVLAN